jgi:NAD(P)-dependent dehydrogenase (short-subunit alcohol dehydrogenase family)
MGGLKFDGRVAVITGAGSGLGRAYARLLASRGARVMVNDVGLRTSSADPSVRPAEETARAIVSEGGQAVANLGDVTSPDDVKALIAETLERFGRIDIVINNAGIEHPVPFTGLTGDELERHLRVHVVGSFLVTQRAWPHMVDQGYGRVVLTSSCGTLGSEQRAHYSAAKGGVFGLMRTLALEGRCHGITANGLWPLAITPMARDAFAGLPEWRQRSIEARATVELVAPVVAWLVHEDCQTNGELLHASAGRVSRVVMAQSVGFRDPELTVESVRDHWTELFAQTPSMILRSAVDATTWALGQSRNGP